MITEHPRPRVRINGEEWNVENLKSHLYYDAKLRACIRRGHRAALAGEPEFGPDYECLWKLLAWHVGWRLGDVDRKLTIN